MIGDYSPMTPASQRQALADISNETQAGSSRGEKRSAAGELDDDNQSSTKRQKKKVDVSGKGISELQKLLRLDNDQESYRLIRVP